MFRALLVLALSGAAPAWATPEYVLPTLFDVTGVAADDRLNIRERPDPSAPIIGTLAGSMLPFVLRKLGQDPASASAPFVATLVDVSGILIYFAIANIILAGILL